MFLLFYMNNMNKKLRGKRDPYIRREFFFWHLKKKFLFIKEHFFLLIV